MKDTDSSPLLFIAFKGTSRRAARFKGLEASHLPTSPSTVDFIRTTTNVRQAQSQLRHEDRAFDDTCLLRRGILTENFHRLNSTSTLPIEEFGETLALPPS